MAKDLQIIKAKDFYKMIDDDSIQEAYQNISKNNLSLKPSTKFSVIVNDEPFPPKDFIRIIAESKGYKIDEATFFGGKANKPFEKLEYIILNKEMSTRTAINKTLLKTYWTKYKAYFRLPDSEQSEKYKWSVLKQVYDNWNWEAENKPQMFKEAFEISGPKNLWMSGNFYPIVHTNWMFENFRIETEDAITNLLNESSPLIDRINSFINFYDTKLPELQELVPDKKINYHSHNDLRAIALYLTLEHPEKYFLFKYGMVKKFCEKMELPKIKAGNKENLESYLNVSNQILGFIKEDKEFINEYRTFTDKENNYDDNNLHLLTQDFIYTLANHFDDSIKYWRIGSNDGENYYFNQMLDEDYIAIGWNEIGDLDAQNVNTKKEVVDLLISHNQEFKTASVRTRKAGEIFDFYFNANDNDIVTLMHGNTVLAIGKITDSYNYNDNLPFAHSRDIIWLKKDVENFILNDGPQTTFYPLVKKQTIDKINKILDTSTPDDIKTNNMDSKQPSLNQILYGPPGTGKTYKTKKLAVEIIEKKQRQYSDSQDDRDVIIERYDEYIKTNQIHFTTFHQSMSYEDFIEGIKPKMNDDEEKELSYEVQDGIFKDICNKAFKSKKVLEKGTGSLVQIEPFDTAWNHLIEEVTEQLANSETPKFNTLTNKVIDVVGITDKGNLLAKPSAGSDLEYIISYNRAKKLFEAFPDLSTIKNIDKEFRGIIGGSNSTAYWSVLNYLHNWITKNQDSFVVESTPVYKDEKQNFVLIIDEINRGNVSGIFGELITLIETDKRAGQKEAISVILPYSKERFSVPDNIYIIGTMNTADRSVEALDTALRRRFSFEEILPKPELLNDHKYQDVNLELLLDKINQRIELLVDKDHQIGHSYFLNINSLEDLKLVFKDKIIPLLEEYFYGDFGKIGLVLGESFIKPSEIKNKSVLATFKDYEDIEFITDKKIFRLKNINEMKESDFISVYHSQE